ncbi:MAG: glycosyltransferase family 2 protein [Lacibacter sp.]
MSTDLLLVTVVALCYNHSRYVVETLESIYYQNYPHLEVFIVDDCSKDDSVALIEKWLQQRRLNWTFIKHVQNQGISKSLNETIDWAKGKYYKAIACDDVLLPHFISTMVERFEQLPEEYAMIYSDVLTINENSEVFGTTPFKERGWDTEEKVPSGKLFDQLAGWCFIPAPGTFLRTRVLQEIRFDESLMLEDWDMWLQIAKRYLIKGIPQAMVQYRIHSASMYQQKSPAYRDHELRTVEKHLGYSKEADVVIKDFIFRSSIQLYVHGGSRPLYWLWRRFVIRPTINNFLHVLLALTGISFEQKEKWRQKWKQAL